MSTFFNRMLARLLGADGAGAGAAQQRYPNTFHPPQGAPAAPGVVRPQVFEPALVHFPRAFRLGEPAFHNPETARRWLDARRRVIDHLLRVVAASAWREHLVLRGSLLLKHWVGEAAREPGDIDWAVVPETLSATEPPGERILDDLVGAVRQHRRNGEPLVDADRIRVDRIWVYSRHPGLRAAFPWRGSELHGPVLAGEVQMDLAFGDPLLIPPQEIDFPAGDGTALRLLAATPEQALAWKLHWLDTDDHPQGKDLYDATLLAERTPMPMGLLEKVLEESVDGVLHRIPPDFPMRWHVDWENFRREYPWVDGGETAWKERLTRALAPTFAGRGTPDAGATA